MGSNEVNTFLSHLAVERNVSASTQNQTLSALLFYCDGYDYGRQYNQPSFSAMNERGKSTLQGTRPAAALPLVLTLETHSFRRARITLRSSDIKSA
jgi:hypothetical protein